jgi:hypothetical protein
VSYISLSCASLRKIRVAEPKTAGSFGDCVAKHEECE